MRLAGFFALPPEPSQSEQCDQYAGGSQPSTWLNQLHLRSQQRWPVQRHRCAAGGECGAGRQLCFSVESIILEVFLIIAPFGPNDVLSFEFNLPVILP